MTKLFSSIVAGVLLSVSCSAAGAQKPTNALPAPTVRPAIDGILAGFQNYPLVAIGNHEDYAQEEDFYAALVRDPHFAREVGNVVVEFGSGAHQDIIDRYLNGGDVSFSDLRKVWSDIVGFNVPYPPLLGSEFSLCRTAANMTRPESLLAAPCGLAQRYTHIVCMNEVAANSLLRPGAFIAARKYLAVFLQNKTASNLRDNLKATVK